MANQILGQEQTSILGNGGTVQPQEPQLVVSKLHNEYSINGNPNIPNKPSPSQLDDRAIVKYMDNLPG
jgi:hypothetical protein